MFCGLAHRPEVTPVLTRTARFALADFNIQTCARHCAGGNKGDGDGRNSACLEYTITCHKILLKNEFPSGFGNEIGQAKASKKQTF